MSRRGFALLTALWLLAALSAVGAASLAAARLGGDVSRNRMLLMRADWAREACGEILLARYAERGAVAAVDTVDLGRGAWCRAAVEDAAGKIDINRAPREILLGLLRNDGLADALLDWRDRNGPFADVAQLRQVRGFDSARVASLRALVTVRGAAPIDLNAAPAGVLAALPGFGAEAVSLVLRRREAGQPIRGGDELLSLLSQSAGKALLARYHAYAGHVGYLPSRVIVRVEGGVRGTRPVSAARLTVVPVPGRLAVIRREAE